MEIQDLTSKIQDISRTIGTLALRKGAFISVAESCTGGSLTLALTQCPGASTWLREGRVAYTYTAKHETLGISAGILDEGLLTSATAEAMAIAMARHTGTEYTVATTGACGPASAEGHDPLYAWVAVCDHGKVSSRLIESEDLGRVGNMWYVTLQALRTLLDIMQR